MSDETGFEATQEVTEVVSAEGTENTEAQDDESGDESSTGDAADENSGE